MTGTIAPEEAIALFSKDGRQWSDSTPVDWRANPAVTKIVIGTLGTGRDAARVPIDLPSDLAVRFPALTHLHLWGIANLETLPELPRGLKCLDVRKCGKLKSLPALPETLEVLDLGECGALKTLPGAPASVSRFFFNKCGSLKPRSLENFLAELRGRPAGAASLVEIDGSGCPAVVTLEEFPRTLQKLVLSGCTTIESVEGLSEFTALQHLNLRGCSGLSVLPDLPDRLQYVELRESDNLTSFLGQDIGPYDRGSEERPNVVKTLYSRRKFGKELATSAHAKLLLLGDGRSGKTTLAKRLRWESLTDVQRNDPAFRHLEPRERETFTPRVEFSEWHTRIKLDPATARSLNERASTAGLAHPCDAANTVAGSIQICDFGGQEIYHQTHRIFASEGSVFAIVWSARDLTEKEMLRDKPDGVREADWLELNRRRSLDYWLDYVQTIRNETKRDIKVMLVCTNCPKGSSQPPWKERAPKHAMEAVECCYIDSLETNCATNPEYKRLVDTIRQYCGVEAARIGILQPAFYSDTAAFVTSLLKQNVEAVRRAERARHLLMSQRDWDSAIAERHRATGASRLTLDAADIESITGYLHESGYIFHLRRHEDGAVLVDQRWASTLIYAILLPGGSLSESIKANHGVFYHGDLEQDPHWRVLESDLERQLLVKYMEQCGIVVRLADREHHREGRDVFLATEKWLLPRFEEIEARLVAELQLISELTGEHSIERFWFEAEEINEFDFKALMAHMGRALGARARYFREGLQATSDESDIQWCFQVRWKPRERDGFLGAIDARLLAGEAHLPELSRQIDDLFAADGSPFARHTRRRETERVTDARHLVDLSRAYYGRPFEWDVAISSSGADEAQVKLLYEALRSALPGEVKVIWYKAPDCRSDDLKEVRRFIDTLGNAKCLLLVLSDAYVRDDPDANWYCTYELADAINKVAAGDRSIEQTVVVYAKDNQINSRNVKETVVALLESMSTAFLARYHGLTPSQQRVCREYLAWHRRFSDAAANTGRLFDARGTMGTYSRVDVGSGGTADFGSLVADVRAALRAH